MKLTLAVAALVVAAIGAPNVPELNVRNVDTRADNLEAPTSRKELVDAGFYNFEEDVYEDEVEDENILEGRARTCCGVYICSGKNFDGKCFHKCYKNQKTITMKKWWKNHAGSFDPDQGCRCYPESVGGGICLSSTTGQSITSYPGGNLGSCINNLKQFHCERFDFG